MGRAFMIGAMVLSTILFIWNFEMGTGVHAASFVVPMVLLVLIVVNSIWSTRLVSWLIFSVSFFSFVVILSAFTLRWRLEEGFDPMPFYRAIFMYVCFVYVSLAQLKLLGSKKINIGGGQFHD